MAAYISLNLSIEHDDGSSSRHVFPCFSVWVLQWSRVNLSSIYSLLLVVIGKVRERLNRNGERQEWISNITGFSISNNEVWNCISWSNLILSLTVKDYTVWHGQIKKIKNHPVPNLYAFLSWVNVKRIFIFD